MSRPVRFIHTADMHLDAPFKGIEGADSGVHAALVHATYRAFERVVDAAIERSVDFVVIAGDAYNAKDISLRAQTAFQAQMRRLAKVGIEAFVAHGNHDPANGWTANLPLPETVHVFAADRVERCVVMRDGEPLCAVYGRSFAQSAETANLAADYRRHEDDAIAVAILHSNVGSNANHAPYAPCSLDDLRTARMDYWALGHIHARGIVLDAPRAAYAGSTQGLQPNETGSRGCYLVEISPSGAVVQEEIDTAEVLWSRATVDLTQAVSIEDVRDLIRDTCEHTRSASARPSILRIELTGRTSIHPQLTRGRVLDDLTEDVRAEQLSGQPWIWLPRLKDRTRPALDLDRIRAEAGFSADVVLLADALLADEDEREALLAELLGPLERSAGTIELDLSSEEIVSLARDVCLDQLDAES